MSARIARDPLPHAISAGRSYVYILPSTHEDILKIGFSRDPLIRMQTLHARYFEYFDMERAVLVEFERVRDARRAEQMLHHALELHNAPAPLDIATGAGGHTEWFRGAYQHTHDAAHRLASQQGHRIHLPIRSWLSQRLIEHSELMFEWSARLLAAIDVVGDADQQARIARQRLRDALDALEYFGIPAQRCASEPVLAWYRNTG